MPAHDSQTPTEQEISTLKSEVKEWAFGIRCVFAVLNVLPLYYCTQALLSAPRFESIFEDMLGSKQKLPGLTRFVLEWSLPLLGIFWLLTALALALIFISKQARHVWITAAVSAFLLIAGGYLVTTALFQPLVSVIQNLSGG